MKRSMKLAAMVGLTVAAGLAQAAVVSVTSGLGGDAGLFGQWVGVSGTNVIVSDGTLGAFVFDAATGARSSLTVPTWSRGVALTGSTAFIAGNDEVYRYSRSGAGVWSGPVTDTSISGYGYDAAADGNLAMVSYDVTSTGGKIRVYEKISGAWTTSLSLGLLDDWAGLNVAIDDLADVALIGGGVVNRNGRLIVGAHTQSVSGLSGAGRAIIYEQSGSAGTTWTRKVLTDPAGAAANDWFGTDVAIAGNYAFVSDGDPVGGPCEVHVFKRNSAGNWGWTGQTLALPIGLYGKSIAAYSDRLLIGVPSASGGAGYAILYQRSGSTYAYESTKAVAGSHANTGSSVALGSTYAVVGGDQSGGAGIVRIHSVP